MSRFNQIQNNIMRQYCFIIKFKNNIPSRLDSFSEAINYVVWEWSKQNNIDIDDKFDYVVVPHDVSFKLTGVSFDTIVKQISKQRPITLQSFYNNCNIITLDQYDEYLENID